MLPTIPVTEPTHWVPATQPSSTSVLPLSRLQSPPDRFTGRKYRWINQTDPGCLKNLVTERIFRLQRDLLLPPSQWWQQAHQLQSLPVTEIFFFSVTERSAAPTIPVLTAASPVTEVTGYREIVPMGREDNLNQQVQWGQQSHQLQRFAGDSQIDRKFFSKLPQPTGYRTYRPGSGLQNLHGPVAS